MCVCLIIWCRVGATYQCHCIGLQWRPITMQFFRALLAMMAGVQAVAAMQARPLVSDVAYKRALKHMQYVVGGAENAVRQSHRTDLPLTPSYVINTLTFNLVAHLVAVNEAAMAWSLSKPTLFGEGIASNLEALAWGVSGALAIGAVELWRCSSTCEIEEDEEALLCPRCSAITNPILIGTAPLAVLSSIILNDATVGERSVRMLSSTRTEPSGAVVRSFDGAPRGLPSSTAVLAFGGALVSCAWAQGIVQTAVCASYHQATMRAAVDASTSSAGSGFAPLALALVIVRTAVEPAATVAATAALVAAFEAVMAHVLQPVTRARSKAAKQAVAHARKRAPILFALEAPADEATLTARAFEEQAAEWELQRDDATRKDLCASAARAAVASAVFAASGGCLVAPVVASLGVLVSLDDLPLVPEVEVAEKPPLAWVAGFTAFAVAWACGSSSIAKLSAAIDLVLA